jgi:ASC-1-like (ASCH) protein
VAIPAAFETAIIMKKVLTLRFRAVDRDRFEDVRSGVKAIETRAATERYKNIRKGDVIVIVCGGHRLTKKVKRARYFKSITAMACAIPSKKIDTRFVSLDAMKKIYYGYSGYKEKIKKFGIVAMELD